MQNRNLVCLGMNHQTAPVEVREQINCTTADLAAHLPQVTAVHGLILISTCNRIELYAECDASFSQAKADLLNLLARRSGLQPTELLEVSYTLFNAQAIDHLFHVVTGLDSLILGEPQILGQVTQARLTAVAHKTLTPYLDTLFHAAIRTGKRARSETTISHNPASISSVAVAQAKKAVGNLQAQSVLVVGVGKMGRLTIKALRSRRVAQIAVANRTVAHAEALVDDWSGCAYSLEQLSAAIAAANVVIATARTEKPLIDADVIGERKRPLTLIDIGVPRNIDPAVRHHDFIQLFGVDELQATLDESLAARQAEVPRVKAIIAEEVDRLQISLREQAVEPLIIDMRRKAEAIRQAELARTLRNLGDLDPEARAHVQHLSRSLINKMLHEPTLRLREAARDDAATDYADTVRTLFGLDP